MVRVSDHSWLLISGDFFFFQAEDGIRDLVRSRGLGDVYKRQDKVSAARLSVACGEPRLERGRPGIQLDAELRVGLSLIHI